MNQAIFKSRAEKVKGTEDSGMGLKLHAVSQMLKLQGQASVSRDVFPPTPPGPEGSNGNGLLRVQWVPGAWLSWPDHP